MHAVIKENVITVIRSIICDTSPRIILGSAHSGQNVLSSSYLNKLWTLNFNLFVHRFKRNVELVSLTVVYCNCDNNDLCFIYVPDEIKMNFVNELWILAALLGKMFHNYISHNDLDSTIVI